MLIGMYVYAGNGEMLGFFPNNSLKRQVSFTVEVLEHMGRYLNHIFILQKLRYIWLNIGGKILVFFVFFQGGVRVRGTLKATRIS